MCLGPGPPSPPLNKRMYQILGTKYLVPSTWYQILGTKYLVPSTWYQVLGTKYLIPGTWYVIVLKSQATFLS